MRTSKKHWEKVSLADELHKKHGLPDIGGLLGDLNDARKAAAYGDTEAPELEAEDVAIQIESYVQAVDGLLKKGSKRA